MLHFKKGDLLFVEGDRSEFIYRVCSGEAEIARQIRNGREVLGKIGVGEFIGEIGVLLACRRSGTARFVTDATVEKFTRDEFLEVALKDSELSARLMHALTLRTRSQVELLNLLPDRSTITRLRHRRPFVWASYAIVRFFEPINEFFRSQIKSRLAPHNLWEQLLQADFPEVTFPKGALLFSEGDPSEQVFWIRSGKVAILKRIKGNNRKVGHAKSRDFVGEMGVLESMPRNASAQATSEVVARMISHSDFFKLLRTSPATYRIVIDSLCERSRRLRVILRDIRAVGTDLPASQPNIFDVAVSIESVGQLADERLVEETLKMRRFLQIQMDHGRYIKNVYQNYLKGKATKEEMDQANIYFRDYLKMAGLGTLFLLPGAVITLPLAVKVGKALGIDILPSSTDSDKDVGAA